ncbi:hypothetical protein L9G74_20260, partial [Shewanella sp. C32]
MSDSTGANLTYNADIRVVEAGVYFRDVMSSVLEERQCAAFLSTQRNHTYKFLVGRKWDCRYSLQ